MAKVYRGMYEENGAGLPVVAVPPGLRIRALMARVRVPGDTFKMRPDLVADADGTVRAGTGGMSVNSNPADIPHFFVPFRLQGVPPFRNGTANDDCRIWSHAVGETPVPRATFAFADQLTLRMGDDTHGTVEPAGSMHHTAYNAAIAATRHHWRIDEPPVRARTEASR